MAERGCSVFWRTDDWNISLQESGTGETFYAVHSGQLAGSPRLDRFWICRARMRACHRGRVEVIGS